MGRSCLLTARVIGKSREPEPPARMMPLRNMLGLSIRVATDRQDGMNLDGPGQIHSHRVIPNGTSFGDLISSVAVFMPDHGSGTIVSVGFIILSWTARDGSWIMNEAEHPRVLLSWPRTGSVWEPPGEIQPAERTG